jgi:hypothetical protein
MQEYLRQRLAVEFTISAKYPGQETFGATSRKVILALALGIPAPFVTKEHYAITISEEHLCRTAGCPIALGVLESDPYIAYALANAFELPWLAARFVVHGGAKIPGSVRQWCQVTLFAHVTSFLKCQG